MVIRDGTAADDAAIKRLNEAAFGGTYEAKLVEELRAAGLAVVELVADEQGVIGHILLSVLDVTVGASPVRALALAPMSVQPGHQRRGIGSS